MVHNIESENQGSGAAIFILHVGADDMDAGRDLGLGHVNAGWRCKFLHTFSQIDRRISDVCEFQRINIDLRAAASRELQLKMNRRLDGILGWFRRHELDGGATRNSRTKRQIGIRREGPLGFVGGDEYDMFGCGMGASPFASATIADDGVGSPE